MYLRLVLLTVLGIAFSFNCFSQNPRAPKDTIQPEFAILRYQTGFYSRKIPRLSLIFESKEVNLENVPDFSLYNFETGKVAEGDKIILVALRFLHKKFGFELLSSMAYPEGGHVVKEFVLRKKSL